MSRISDKSYDELKSILAEKNIPPEDLIKEVYHVVKVYGDDGYDKVKLLLDRGARNMIDEEFREYPDYIRNALSQASRNIQPKLVELLLDYGANPNWVDEEFDVYLAHVIEIYAKGWVEYDYLNRKPIPLTSEQEDNLLHIIDLYFETEGLNPEWLVKIEPIILNDDKVVNRLLPILDRFFSYELASNEGFSIYYYLIDFFEETYFFHEDRVSNPFYNRLDWYLEITKNKPRMLRDSALFTILANEGDLSIHPKEFIPF